MPPKKKKPAKKRRAASKTVASEKEFLKGLPDDNRFHFFSDYEFASVTERLPTGVLAFDRLTGGGWPVGRIVELASWEGVGKSTLLDQSIAHAQRTGVNTVLIDTESARDAAYMKTLGVNLDKLVRVTVVTMEDCFEAIDDILDRQEVLGAKKPLFIVWDSIGGTPPKVEVEGAPGDKHVAASAKVINQNFRRMHNRLAPLRVSLVCANRFYRGIGQYAKPLETTGGSGMLYAPSLRIWLSNKGQIKIGTQVVGHQVGVRLKKSRISTITGTVIAGLIHGSGYDNSYTLFDWSLEHGIGETHRFVTRSGAWYQLHEPEQEVVPFQRGFVGFGQLLEERTDLYQSLATHYLTP